MMTPVQAASEVIMKTIHQTPNEAQRVREFFQAVQRRCNDESFRKATLDDYTIEAVQVPKDKGTRLLLVGALIEYFYSLGASQVVALFSFMWDEIAEDTFNYAELAEILAE